MPFYSILNMKNSKEQQKPFLGRYIRVNSSKNSQTYLTKKIEVGKSTCPYASIVGKSTKVGTSTKRVGRATNKVRITTNIEKSTRNITQTLTLKPNPN